VAPDCSQESTAMTKARSRTYRHCVYVVELDRDVLYEPRFRAGNPRYDGFAPCVYVGMTGLSPQLRFQRHKAGIKSNRFVQRYGLRLRPDLYECFNPMPMSAALELEQELAEDFRERGWAVWQA
jgi:predicted GIY-YIG superfamily endonuclease